MAETTELHRRIAGVLAGALNIEVPAVDTDLFESGVLDSLAFVELLLQLEREFGIATSVDDLELENFRTIAHISEFVLARTADVFAAPNTLRVVQIGARR
jgi:D-alanine--poly(phosphoribitol) ligase subunit 2